MPTSKSREKSFWEKFLTIFGDIKVFPYPMFMVYDPGSYKMKGEDVRALLDQIQPGDILLRGYDNYLDGKFIGGSFSHAAFYYGDCGESDRDKAGAAHKDAAHRKTGQEKFKVGKQMVVHSIAEGVLMEDLLTFCRCDRVAILRLPGVIKKTSAEKIFVDGESFGAKEEAVYQALKAGGTANRSDVIPLAQELALRQLGKEYDFGFNFKTHKSLYCTEFVYYIYRSVCPFLAVAPITKRILFMSRQGLDPDCFLTTDLLRVWANPGAAGRKGVEGKFPGC